ncbi:MAG: thiol-disulfide isomerase [Kaistia sp. SCN 65-12]|nr:MAG: thiol-disulfide isomerase [Kaistia sp. SCN 65-12]
MSITGDQAPELRVPVWIDADGKPRAPLSLADLGPGYKILYCFQHWCPGCHSSGFPTLIRLVDALKDKGFGFAVVQTVFEGSEENTVERLRETQQRYGLRLPFGHDPLREGGRYPTLMEDYGTGGTPWFILIDPKGTVLFSNFHFDADHFLRALGLEAANPA